MYKLCFYVPESHLETVKQALFHIGVGKIGHYDCCAWQVKGEGQFRPLEGSNPSIGKTNQIEKIEEYKVEMVCEDSLIEEAIMQLKMAHPYEEPAYQVWHLQDITLRCFIAIPIEENAKKQIQKILNTLHSRIENPHIRWTPPENIHLTLRFLGSTHPQLISIIQEKLEETLQTFSRFTLNLNHIQLFPTHGIPKVITLGAQPNSEIKELAATIENMATQLGFESEIRPFTPHITLARMKDAKLPKINLDFDPISVDVSKVTLYHSKTHQEGAVYQVLKEFELKYAEY
ncbi:MAG: RNA 2',3'-cyclic phosphodiesterase [Proteobacteria bacterium]|nr:RNA 2',3'-cyclic phosphodiesterase [Pseudomonadota bacterium]